MPYSHVTRTMHGADAIAYARGYGQGGHNGAESRNLYVTGVNMLPESCGLSYSEQMQKFWDRASANHSIQVNRFIISFHPDELDADDPRDQLTALDIGVEFAKTNCPHSQSAIFLQNDGTGHKLHLHIVSNDVRMDNYKGVDAGTYFHMLFSQTVDKICQKYFKLKQSEPAPERVTQAVRGRRMENERIEAGNAAEARRAMAEGRPVDKSKIRPLLYIWQDDLRDRIRQAADGAKDEADFARRLRMDGVELVPRKLKDGTLVYKRPATKTHPEHYTYELVDTSNFDGKIPFNLKARSHKLGTDFMPDAVAKLFAKQPQAQATAQAEREQVIKLPEAPKPKASRPKAPEKPKAQEPKKPPAKPDNGVQVRAYLAARTILWVPYAEYMGLDPDAYNDNWEEEETGILPLERWNDFGLWRSRRKAELEAQGRKLEPVFDRTGGGFEPRKDSLLEQFTDFLATLAAERLRRKAAKQREAMLDEWASTGGAGDGKGDREYGDDD